MNRSWIPHNTGWILAHVQGWCWWLVDCCCPCSGLGILSSFLLASLTPARACFKFATSWKVQSLLRAPTRKWYITFKCEFLWRKLGHVTRITAREAGKWSPAMCHTYSPAKMGGQGSDLCYSSVNFCFKREISHTSGEYFFSCLYLLESEMDFSMFKVWQFSKKITLLLLESWSNFTFT